MALLLGYDVGSSSIKATLMDAGTGSVLASATSPQKELEIVAAEIGWAEQEPSVWWEHVVEATQKINAQAKFDAGDVAAIGISYQMHGLVVVDENKHVLRPSIIWCDSRAVQIGEQAAEDIGGDKCLKKLFNLPGNFEDSQDNAARRLHRDEDDGRDKDNALWFVRRDNVGFRRRPVS